MRQTLENEVFYVGVFGGPVTRNPYPAPLFWGRRVPGFLIPGPPIPSSISPPRLPELGTESFAIDLPSPNSVPRFQIPKCDFHFHFPRGGPLFKSEEHWSIKSTLYKSDVRRTEYVALGSWKSE